MTEPNSKVVMNFAVGTGWYQRGQKRLRDSLTLHGVDCDGYSEMSKDPERSMFFTHYPKDCPSHTQIPWGFKLWSFGEAIRRGHRYALWCDAAVWAVKDLTPVFNHIGEHGHFFFTYHDFDCDQTANDNCLKHFDLKREEAAKIESIYACIMGLDLHNPRSLDFLYKWQDAMLAGCFNGDGNKGATDGSGPRYLFHRHDQVTASILIHQLGMSVTEAGYLAQSYAEQLPETVCLTTRGM